MDAKVGQILNNVVGHDEVVNARLVMVNPAGRIEISAVRPEEPTRESRVVSVEKKSVDRHIRGLDLNDIGVRNRTDTRQDDRLRETSASVGIDPTIGSPKDDGMAHNEVLRVSSGCHVDGVTIARAIDRLLDGTAGNHDLLVQD